MTLKYPRCFFHICRIYSSIPELGQLHKNMLSCYTYCSRNLSRTELHVKKTTAKRTNRKVGNKGKRSISNRMSKAKERSRRLSQIVARVWADQQFKDLFLTHPERILKQYGIEIPSSVKVCIVEDTQDLIHLVLPAKPSFKHLSLNNLPNDGRDCVGTACDSLDCGTGGMTDGLDCTGSLCNSFGPK